MKNILRSTGAMLLLAGTQVPAMTTAELDQAWPAFTAPTSGLDTRFCWDILLEAAAAGWHPERMQQMISVAAHSFDSTPGDAMYGNLGINYGQPVPTDANVGIFCMQCAAATWELYRSNLPADAQASLSAAMTLGLNHVLSYNVGPDYTNIYLLKACDAILLGESLGNATAANLGYTMLGTWITYTQANGVGEFLSPTYYGVDLESMATTQRLAQLASGRFAASVIQNLLWTDIAAHWFAPTEVIAGAHGRDHDYLHGHGKCDVQLQLAGWLKNRTPDIEDFPDASSAYFTIAESTPPTSVSAILQQIPRTVTARWGSSQRTAYISNHVSLASCSGSYTIEDKLLNMSMAGTGDPTVNVAYVMDGINDPYGQVSTPNSVGNISVQHLTPKVLAQQSGSDALYLVSEQLALGSSGFAALNGGVHSDILIPNGASLWSGNTPVSLPAAGTQLSLSATVPLFIHYGDAAVGIRVVYADEVNGSPSTLALVNDGGAYNTCRLLIEHAATNPTASVNVQLALHVEVSDGLTSATYATFRSNMMATTYAVTATSALLNVSATTGNGLLHLAMNLTSNQPSIIGYTPTTSVLMVNGVDVASSILSSTPPAPAPTPTPAPAPAVTTTPAAGPTSTPNASPSPASPTTAANPSDPATPSTDSTSSDVASDGGSGHGCGLGSGVGLFALVLGSWMRSARRR